MNSTKTHGSSAASGLLSSLFANRELCYALIQREVVGRYRGSVLGVLWSFFNPLFMLGVYTLFFSVVFQSRWGNDPSSKSDFAVILFAGLIIFNLFSECVSKSPTVIISNPNYVKKILFPLEILAVVTVGSALFHFLISFSVWVLFYLFVVGLPSATILLLPIVLFPFTLFLIGCCWILSSLGVLLRDLNQATSLLTTALMFTSPVFFPLSSIPEHYRMLLGFNPLTWPIEAARGIMLWDQLPSILSWAAYLLFSVTVFVLGYFVFQALRKWFADIV